MHHTLILHLKSCPKSESTSALVTATVRLPGRHILHVYGIADRSYVSKTCMALAFRGPASLDEIVDFHRQSRLLEDDKDTRSSSEAPDPDTFPVQEPWNTIPPRSECRFLVAILIGAADRACTVSSRRANYKCKSTFLAGNTGPPAIMRMFRTHGRTGML